MGERFGFSRISRKLKGEKIAKLWSLAGLERACPTSPPTSPRAPGSGSYARPKARPFSAHISRTPGSTFPKLWSVAVPDEAFRKSPPTGSDSTGSPRYGRSKSATFGDPGSCRGRPRGPPLSCPGKAPRGTPSPEFELSGPSRCRDTGCFSPIGRDVTGGGHFGSRPVVFGRYLRENCTKTDETCIVLFSSTRRFQRDRRSPDPLSFRRDICVLRLRRSPSRAPGGPRGRGWSPWKAPVPLYHR